MATPLDLGLLGRFADIFPFLLVLAVVYALLSKLHILGDNKGLNGLVAFVLALLTLFSPTIKDSITMMAPWFVWFFMFIVFLMVAFMMFGAKESDFFHVLKEYPTALYWILAIALIIWLGSLTTVMSKSGGVGAGTHTEVNSDTGQTVVVQDQQSEFWKTITHPKVLGLALILLIATFTVARLSSS